MLMVDTDSVMLERRLLTGELACLLVEGCCGRGATPVGGFPAGHERSGDGRGKVVADRRDGVQVLHNAERAEQRQLLLPCRASGGDQGFPACCLKMAITRSGSSGLKAGWTKPPRSSTTSLSFRGRLMSRESQ